MSPCHPRIDIPACSISLGIGMRSTIRDTLDIRASTDIKEYPVPSPYRYGAISVSLPIVPPASEQVPIDTTIRRPPCVLPSKSAYATPGGVLSRACFRESLRIYTGRPPDRGPRSSRRWGRAQDNEKVRKICREYGNTYDSPVTRDPHDDRDTRTCVCVCVCVHQV